MNRKSASVLSDLDCSRLITDSLSSTNPLHIATPSLDYSNMDGSNICVTDAAFGMQGMPLFNSYSPQHGINIHGLSSWHIEAELGDSLLPDSRIGKGGVTVYTRLSAHARWIRKVSGVIDHPRLEFVGPFQDVDVKDNTLKFSPVVVDGPII